MELLANFFDFFLHIDKHLDILVTQYGVLVYAILFIIIFCETGLVITPVLPGDSLLFAAGATIASVGIADSSATMNSSGSAINTLATQSLTTPLSIHYMALILIVAAILGDATNYFIGQMLGEKAFIKYPKIFRPSYLEKTRHFYKKYGGKTIIFARFVPIVRTFAPFLAGVGTMSYREFAIYNIVGACLWIGMFLYGGFFFGTIPAVKNNFTLVILTIIALSILPPVVEVMKAKISSSKKAST
jgi:membrane-associated protein